MPQLGAPEAHHHPCHPSVLIFGVGKLPRGSARRLGRASREFPAVPLTGAEEEEAAKQQAASEAGRSGSCNQFAPPVAPATGSLRPPVAVEAPPRSASWSPMSCGQPLPTPPPVVS